jgi:hypothetical protein
VVKLIVVLVSGVTPALHAHGAGRAWPSSALTGISALAALFLGILLAG